MANYDQLIYDIARQEGFTDVVAKMIAAQARLESTNYTSTVLQCNNNMFGMKYVRQPLSMGRGTIAPSSELSGGCTRIDNGGCDKKGTSGCKDGDFYAKYDNPEKSIRDTIQRLYKTTRKGIGFNEINSSTDTTSYANNLKKRDYYGSHDFSTAAGQQEAKDYAKNLKYLLSKVSVTAWIKDVYATNKKTINYALIGGVIIGLTGYAYYLYKKKIIKI